MEPVRQPDAKPADQARPAGRPLVLVCGVGMVGSAVAHVLAGAGVPVVVCDDRPPMTLRWHMSFAAALAYGDGVLEGRRAVRVADADAARRVALAGGPVPVLPVSLADAVPALAPDVVVDARIKDEREAASIIGLAPLTIGVGPRFCAGETVDAVIESCWGPDLGRVIRAGRAEGNPCAPEIIEGLGWERFAASPAAGTVAPLKAIGRRVAAGEAVATVAGVDVPAPVAGVVRGLSRPGARVAVGDKVAEIDPRTDGAQVTGLGIRARRIAEGVLRLVRPPERDAS